MSLTKLPSGRWRAQVYDPVRGHNVSVSRVLGVSGTFTTRAEAKRARELARARLGEDLAKPVTLAAFWERWTTDPLFARPKESRTASFTQMQLGVELGVASQAADTVAR